MTLPINNDNDETVEFMRDPKVGVYAPSKVGISDVNPGLKSQAIQDSNPYADDIARLKKEKADLQQKLNDLISEKDKLKEDYANASWYKQIGLGVQLGAKALQILFTAAYIERVEARIKEYEKGGPIFKSFGMTEKSAFGL